MKPERAERIYEQRRRLREGDRKWALDVMKYYPDCVQAFRAQGRHYLAAECQATIKMARRILALPERG